MPDPQFSELQDLLNTTTPNYGKGTLTNLMHDLQEFIMLPMILRDQQVKFRGGTSIDFRAAIGTSGAARNVGRYAQDVLVSNDITIVGSVPWRSTTTNMTWDEGEIDLNAGEEQILSEIKLKRQDMVTDLAKRMELDGWSKPDDSSDTLTPWGVRTWIVASQTEGFNGTNPTGFSTGVGGINSTTYPGWANYTNAYTNVNKTDLVRKMRKAYYKTGFKPPVSTIPEAKRGPDRWGIYAPYDVVAQLEELAEQQNENLGNDLASKDDKTTFRRVSITPVPQLDSDTTNPVIGINWSEFYPVFKTGWFMREVTKDVAGQHTVVATHLDNIWNICCKNRRKQWILVSAT